jgi:hypothetical protein
MNYRPRNALVQMQPVQEVKFEMVAPGLRIFLDGSLARQPKINQILTPALGVDNEITKEGGGICIEIIKAYCFLACIKTEILANDNSGYLSHQPANQVSIVANVTRPAGHKRAKI